VIFITYAFQRLEVKGQGSIFTSPALYKGEQNGARGRVGGAESGDGAQVRQSGSRGSVSGKEGESGRSSSQVEESGLEGSKSRETEIESELREGSESW